MWTWGTLIILLTSRPEGLTLPGRTLTFIATALQTWRMWMCW